MFLVVYVDEFKLAGPKANMAEGWKIIQMGLPMVPPAPLGIFLGCDLRRREVRLPDGVPSGHDGV